MAYSVFAFTSRANPHLLAERMYRQQWKRGRFAQFVAPNFVKATRAKEEVTALAPDGPSWTGAPVEVHEEFVKMGRTTLDIPVRNRLIGRPKFGDKPLQGSAERAIITFRQVQINYTRKAYAPPTGMSLQIVKQYADDLVEKADSYLSMWLNDWHPGNFLLALTAGYSQDLLAAAAEGGRAATIMSHPNFFTAGAGQVAHTALPGTAGYEAAVESAVNGLSNVAGDYFSVAVVRNMVAEASRKKIATIVTKDGYDFYPIFISQSQWNQLRADTEFKNWVQQIPDSITKSVLGNNAFACIGGAILYVDDYLVSAYTNAIDANVTAGTVQYGPRPTAAERGLGFTVGNMIQNRDDGNIKLAMLIGQSCMTVGVGQRMSFTEETWDHNFLREIGINFIQSVVRNDQFDVDGLVSGLTAGDFYENTSSLICATYSPDALSW